MLSIIIPALDEADNVERLVAELTEAAEALPIGEVIYVDDGSTDGTLAGEVVRLAESSVGPSRQP